jgi:hypothetical protein
MNFYRFWVVVVLLSFFFVGFTSQSFAADTPSPAMLKIAEIMHRLKHFPSPVGKSTLQKLAEKSSTNSNEKTLIQAMMNLQHQVTSADRGKLTALAKDANANVNERSVASILLNLDHRPTKQDKVILGKILGK